MVPRHILISILILLPIYAFGQFTYAPDQSVAVQDENGNSLPLAWAGGLNSAQFNKMDLNGDKVDDLVIFDRMADQVLTFVTSNGAYQYAPEYVTVFPPQVTRFLLLRDFNCDGKKDVFTGHNFGITVFLNATGDDGVIRWDRFYFYTDNSKSESVVTQGFSQKINIQLQFDDLPAFADIDGDTDLDIMNVRFTGNGSIEFHKNMSMERYGVCDSLDFVRVTQAWGGVTQCRCESFVFNNEDCSTGGGRVKHGDGKALLALDLNNDGEKDVLFSEAECPNIFSLINHGTFDNPVITEAGYFPVSDQVNINIFPAAFYEDIDFDGIQDLIATPNNIQRDFVDQDYNSSTWLYKNTGSNESPEFSFVKNAFLQENMIDAGDNSVPAFVDADNDGDLDMFVGFYSDETGFGSIYQYTNIGTVTMPQFKLVDRNFLNISSLGLYNIKPQFADLNRDGRSDLTFVGTNGETNKTNVCFLTNNAPEGIEFNLGDITLTDLGLITKKTPAWAKELKEIIQDQLDTNLTLRLKEVSQSLNVHPTYLSREFSKYFDNFSFGDYIRKLRIEKAIQLLTQSNQSLAEIAYLTGFSDQSHFNRIFKKNTGKNPSEYRKKSRKT